MDETDRKTNISAPTRRENSSFSLEFVGDKRATISFHFRSTTTCNRNYCRRLTIRKCRKSRSVKSQMCQSTAVASVYGEHSSFQLIRLFETHFSRAIESLVEIFFESSAARQTVDKSRSVCHNWITQMPIRLVDSHELTILAGQKSQMINLNLEIWNARLS